MSLINFVTESSIQKLVADQVVILDLPDTVRQQLETTFGVAYSFFRQPLEVKQRGKFSQDMGYRQVGDEYSQSPSQPDQMESFSVSPRVPLSLSRLKLAGADLLYLGMSAIFDVMESVTEELVIKLADHFSPKSNSDRLKGRLRGWSRLQINYSRPSELLTPLINEVHEDLDLLTLTVVPIPGLEIKFADNTFIPVTTTTAQVLILPGEIAWLLTGGKLQPLYHRVRSHTAITERLSLVFFGDLEPNQCEPWIANEVNFGVDIGRRVLTNIHRFGLVGFDSENN